MLRVCIIAVLSLCCMSTLAKADLTVTSKRVTTEQTKIDSFVRSIIKGLGTKVVENPDSVNLEKISGAIQQLDINPEALKIDVQDFEGGDHAIFAVNLEGDDFKIEQVKVDNGFEIEDFYHYTVTLDFWITVRGNRIKMQQEFDYNKSGFIMINIKVLSGIGRMRHAHFSGEILENLTDDTSRVATSLAITARLPNCKLVNKIATKKIGAISSHALLTLDQEVRSILSQKERSLLELAPLIAERALGGSL